MCVRSEATNTPLSIVSIIGRTLFWTVLKLSPNSHTKKKWKLVCLCELWNEICVFCDESSAIRADKSVFDCWKKKQVVFFVRILLRICESVGVFWGGFVVVILGMVELISKKDALLIALFCSDLWMWEQKRWGFREKVLDKIGGGD